MTLKDPDRQHWEDLPKSFSVDTLDWMGILADLKARAYSQLINDWFAGTQHHQCLLTDLYEAAMDQTPFLSMLQEQAGSIVGMDISLAAVQMARRNLQLRKKDVLIVADIKAPPFASQSFELIFSPSTLDHFRTKSAFIRTLKGLHGILKKQGRILLTLDNPQNITDPLLRLASFLGFLPFYVGKTYRRKYLIQILQETGWHPEKVKTIIHHPRMMGVFLAKIGQIIQKECFTTFMRDYLQQWQNFDGTRWQFQTGCFLAVLAIKNTERRRG